MVLTCWHCGLWHLLGRSTWAAGVVETGAAGGTEGAVARLCVLMLSPPHRLASVHAQLDGTSLRLGLPSSSSPSLSLPDAGLSHSLAITVYGALSIWGSQFLFSM